MPPPLRLLVFNDGYSAEAFSDISHPAIEFTCVPDGDRAQLLEMIPGYDAYLSTLRIRVDREVVDRASRLRLIVTPSTGTDHLDLPLLRERNITVLCNKDDREFLDQLTTTAELAFGLLLTCARRLPECFEASRAGRWERSGLAGSQLRGKTLGLIGVGRLGSMMARYGRAFWMRVLGCDPAVREFPEGVERVDLQALLRESDFVSLHVHLTELTRGMLGERELAAMKPGSCLINTSRGGLVDEEALVRHMQSGRIAAAGLDVIDGEWIGDKRGHPLIAYSRVNPRLCITPHVGGTSPEAVRLSVRHTFRKAVAFLGRETPAR